jgi:hypothetical protein
LVLSSLAGYEIRTWLADCEKSCNAAMCGFKFVCTMVSTMQV